MKISAFIGQRVAKVLFFDVESGNSSSNFFPLFFRSRRQEAKPSTSLILQLMDFECKLRAKKQDKKVKNFDWKNLTKLAVPLSIYFMIFALICKVIYDSIFKKDQEEDEIVCY